MKQIYFNQQWIGCNALILATGHSASDTILMLHQHGIHVENKPFAVGVRIEHKQIISMRLCFMNIVKMKD